MKPKKQDKQNKPNEQEIDSRFTKDAQPRYADDCKKYLPDCLKHWHTAI